MTETVVVGAGIGGLATGILLARSGRSVTLYERSDTIGGEAALVLRPNGLAVLDAIGVTEQLRTAGSELRSLRLFDHRLRVISDVPLPGGDTHGHALVVPRATVRQILVDAARKEGVDLVLGRAVTAVVAESADDRPVVTVAPPDGGPAGDGPDGETGRSDGKPAGQPEEVVCDLVVGADGAGSITRSAFPPDSTSVRPDRRYLRAVVDWTVSPALVGEHWTRRGIAGLLPCGDGRTYWYASATPAIVRAIGSGDLARIKKVVAAAHPQLLHVVNAVSDVARLSLATTHSVRVEQLYHHHVVLVGDAAHAMAPNFGQGANSALVDAGVLAWELSQRDDPADALAAYDARRTPAVARARADAERLSRLAHFGGGRRVRNAAVRILPDRFVESATRRAQQVDLPSFRAELRSLAAD